MPRLLLVTVLAALIGGPAAAQTPPAGHHGQGHAEHHDWYEKLKQPGTNASCCNAQKRRADGVLEGDCRPTRAYQKDDGHWYALLNGRWVQIPPRAVLKELSPDGNSHICAGPSGRIFCFLGGSPKS
ncbi:MAG: hypothetical protein K2Y40_24860 [Reyranella sp.]|nr:hypothetical protein [Reyranella sp.]